MSLSGPRDPANPSRDTYSKLEADAVAYAVSKGVLVVAAVGNSDQSPSQPWPYASWPAALPHVLGVSALNRKGGVPAFSNRDPQFNDIAAPGEDILSTLPLALTAMYPGMRRAGLFELRAGRVPLGRGHELRDAAGHGCRRDAHRHLAGARARPGAGAARAERRRCAAGQRLLRVHGRPRSLHRRREARSDCRASSSSRRARRRVTATSRTTAPARAPIRSSAPAVTSPPRSTTGTTATTSTASISVPGERLVATTAARRTGVVPALSLWRPGTPTRRPASVPSQRLLARPAGLR